MAEAQNHPQAETVPPALAPLLDPGEKLLWTAQPRPYVYIVRGLPAIAYGMTWSILGAYWYHGAGGVGKYSAFDGWWRLIPVLSLPFIFAGFSFFLYPMKLGAQARRTWYVVTDRRVFIAEIFAHKPPQLRVFSANELAPPLAVKRFDGLYNLVLTHRAQEGLPHLNPRLEDAFFGLPKTEAASEAVDKFARGRYSMGNGPFDTA
jgi:hypothetical protein